MALVHTAAIQLPGMPARSFYHRGTPADIGVIQQIFEAEHYSLEPLLRRVELDTIYDALASGSRPPLILDAGANIGASVVYFGLTYPGAHIVALEPAPNNFEVLQANIAGINVDARCAAIGCASGETALIDPGRGEWGYRTLTGAAGERVPVLSAAELVAAKVSQGFEPFIAKIDIEGGEADLFSRATDWVDAFPLIIIELHDWLLPQSANSRNFLKCIAGKDRDFVYIGENVFSIANG